MCEYNTMISTPINNTMSQNYTFVIVGEFLREGWINYRLTVSEVSNVIET